MPPLTAEENHAPRFGAPEKKKRRKKGEGTGPPRSVE